MDSPSANWIFFIFVQGKASAINSCRNFSSEKRFEKMSQERPKTFIELSQFYQNLEHIIFASVIICWRVPRLSEESVEHKLLKALKFIIDINMPVPRFEVIIVNLSNDSSLAVDHPVGKSRIGILLSCWYVSVHIYSKRKEGREGDKRKESSP